MLCYSFGTTHLWPCAKQMMDMLSSKGFPVHVRVRTLCVYGIWQLANMFDAQFGAHLSMSIRNHFSCETFIENLRFLLWKCTRIFSTVALFWKKKKFFDINNFIQAYSNLQIIYKQYFFLGIWVWERKKKLVCQPTESYVERKSFIKKAAS